MIYPQIQKNPSSIYSFLLVAGYLKAEETVYAPSGDYMCRVSLPNKEISFVYNKEILSKLEPIVPQSLAISIQESIYRNDALRLKMLLEKLLRESGKGRYDIQLMPRKPEDTGFIFELKAEKNAEQDKLKALADQALQQIAEKKYAEEMHSQGVVSITQYGVSFSGKHVEISVFEG